MRFGAVIQLSLVLTMIAGWGSACALATESAMVLPQGRSRLSLIYAESADISQQYDNNGNTQSVVAPYNLELSAQTLSKANSDLASIVNILNSDLGNYHYDPATGKVALGGATAQNGGVPLGNALDKGFLNLDAIGQREQYNVAYAYGITDRLTVGFMMPFIRTQVNVADSITGSDSTQSIASQIAALPNVAGTIQNTLNQIAGANDGTLRGMLTSLGYDANQSYNGSGIGDIVFGGRYNYFNKKTKAGEFLSTFQLGASAPTGYVHTASQLIAPSYGSGCWELSAANIFNYNPFSWLTLGNGLHYTWQLPDTRDMRVDPNAFIPGPNSDQMVNEKQGDKYSATLGATFHLTKAIDFDSGYEWDLKNTDQYSGSQPIDYSYLSYGTYTYLEQLSFGISISTIPAFLKYDFPLPAQFAVNVYIPTAGKNLIIAPYGTAELDIIF